MGSVHFIGGEKGGVGKSFTARLLAQYLIDHGVPWLGFDTDRSHATFSRFYGEFTRPVDINKDSSLDRIIEACVDYPGHDLIIDLAAQSQRRLDQWIKEGDVFSLFCEVGIPVYYWHVMDDGADSSYLLESLLARYTQPDMRFVVVQNHGRGDNFDDFERSAAYRLAQTRNTYVLSLDRLQSELTQKIDFNNSSFWSAINNENGLSIIGRQRMRVWLQNAYRKLDDLFAEQPAEMEQTKPITEDSDSP